MVVAVTAVTITNAVVTAEQITSVGESSHGGTSFQGTFDHTDADIPAIKGTFTCTDGPCSLVYYGQRGRCHGHDRDRLHVFRTQGRRHGCGWPLRRQTTSSSVSWLDETDRTMAPPTIPSGPSQRVDSRSQRTPCYRSRR